MPAKQLRKRAPSSLTLFPARDPEILDAQATAQMLGISTHAVHGLFKKGELPGRKVARRWLTTRDAVLRWLKGSSEEDALTRAIANGDKNALAAALKSEGPGQEAAVILRLDRFCSSDNLRLRLPNHSHQQSGETLCPSANLASGGRS
jgi:hypothetical protein